MFKGLVLFKLDKYKRYSIPVGFFFDPSVCFVQESEKKSEQLKQFA